MTTIGKKIKSRGKPHTVAASSKKVLLYDKDFVKWTQAQADLLKEGHLDKLDIVNLIEEIESLGRSDKRALKSHLIILLQHLLKEKYQPEMMENSNSWKSSINNSKMEIELILEDSPSLKKELNKMLPKAYSHARVNASIETDLDEKIFPEECPWEIQEILPFINAN